MEKLLTGISNVNIAQELDLLNDNLVTSMVGVGSRKHEQAKTLASCVQYFSKLNDIENDLSGIRFGFDNVVLNDELSDKKVRNIAYMLAEAVDSNSVERIRQLKFEYGNDKDFLVAKEFLNEKCKEIWNVFNSSDKNTRIPYDAMKALGISNQPSLEFLLGNSIRYYEKDNGVSTANLIEKILNNENIHYDLTQIHKYLKTLCEKEKCKYNFRTVEYLISQQNYGLSGLQELGIDKVLIKKVFCKLNFKHRICFLIKNPQFFKFLLK
ncbi:hypothetical protein HDR58_02375 [bacterium]|nr:hypothetical protein [bacterium]